MPAVAGPGDCATPNTLGPDGKCYAPCPSGYEPIDSYTCAGTCPSGYLTTDLSCIRPLFPREIKPYIGCPTGSTRLYDICLLPCGSDAVKAQFELCVPQCPDGFSETADRLSCQAEFARRSATVREACYANETRLNNLCLSACEMGMVPYELDPELCYRPLPSTLQPFFWNGTSGSGNTLTHASPIVSKVITPRARQAATCPQNFDNVNGVCYGECPVGTQAIDTHCAASCPPGFLLSPNKTACVRPVLRRQIAGNTGVSRWRPFLIVGLVLLGVIILAFLRGQLGKR